MLEPDSTRIAPSEPRTPTGALGSQALQILTTEHWSLLAARSLVYTEAMSRTSIFVAALGASVVSLTGFVTYAAREIGRYRAEFETRFPTPPATGAS